MGQNLLFQSLRYLGIIKGGVLLHDGTGDDDVGFPFGKNLHFFGLLEDFIRNVIHGPAFVGNAAGNFQPLVV
ncbi:hypothetical protein D3C75_1056790 [compost metagenome]